LVEIKINDLYKEKMILEDSYEKWIAIFSETGHFTKDILKIVNIFTRDGNIAGVVIPIFDDVDFIRAEYDLITTPLWLDIAVENMERTLRIDLEVQVLLEQIRLLKKELQTTNQRVNLFEKIKIPETKANVKKIGVYLGDQQTAAVVRGKIAKRAMEVST
jgi:V/A-type H+-transporting ATPase subunit D